MFKIIMLVKKKPELSTEAFIARWQQHSEKVLGFKDVLNIRHYTKTLPLQASGQPATQRGTLPFEFDAMGELWYDSRAGGIGCAAGRRSRVRGFAAFCDVVWRRRAGALMP